MLTLTVHSLFFTLAILVAVGVVLSRRQQFDGAIEPTLTACVWIVGLGFLGARLAYLLAYPDSFSQFWDVFTYYQGGLISFGGILAGLWTAYWQAYRFPQKLRQHWLAAVVVAGLWGWAVGRWGNYFQAESGGVTVGFLGGSQMPIQILESVGCVLLAVYLTRSSFKPIQTVWTGLIGYLVLRFLVDFWRAETVFAGLRVSQWAVLIFIIILTRVYARVLDKTVQAGS